MDELRLIFITDDAGSACRGAINMRIARLHMDAQDKTRFEIHGKSSVKYHLKANHVVEAKRWFWALNNAIQWTKDEAREDEKRQRRDAELLRQAREGQSEKLPSENASEVASITSGRPLTDRGLTAPIHSSASKVSFHSLRSPASNAGDDGASAYDSYDPSVSGHDITRMTSNTIGTATVEGDVDDEEEYGDDASSHEMQPVNKDAFNITAQSAKVQLDLLAQVSGALQKEKLRNPGMVISDPTIDQALSAYEAAVSSLNGLVVDLLKISRDRDAFWQYRLDREADARKMWEDSMARVAKEHEELQNKIGESEDKRKRTKRALKEALETASVASSRPGSRGASQDGIQIAEALEKMQLSREGRSSLRRKSFAGGDSIRRKSVIVQFTDLSDSESGDDEEFFDAVDAGEVEVVEDLPLTSPGLPPAKDVSTADLREEKKIEIIPSFKGYEDPVRKRLKLDADDRPKISLWVSSAPV
jgi:oxysterol-binding protein 1